MELGKLYALAAGLLWGFTPIFTKLSLAGASVRLVMVVGSVSGFALLVLVGLAQGQQGWFNEPLSTLAIYIAIGISGSLIGRIFYIKGIEKIGGSRSTSITNSSPLLTTFFAIFLLGERLTPATGTGIFFIVFGIYLISMQRSGQGPMNFRRIDLLWPLASAFCYSFNPVLKRLSMIMTPSPLLGVFYSHGTSMVIFVIAFIAQGAWGELKTVPARHMAFMILGGFTTTIGAYMTFLAVQNQPALIVSSIWRLSPLISLFGSYFLLRDHEEVTLKDLLGTVSIVGGVAVLVRLAS